MIIKFVIWTLTALLPLCFASIASGQNASNNSIENWENVTSLAVGQRVIVKTKSGAIAKGLMGQVTNDSLVVIGKKQAQTLKREDVRQVHTARKSKVLGVVGGIIGGIAGFVGSAVIVGAVASETSSEAVAYSIIPIAIAATAGGAVVGNRIGNRERKQRLVYQAP